MAAQTAREVLTSRRPVLAISPHLDDVVLSAEAFVGRPDGPHGPDGPDATGAIDVLTVCTGRPAVAESQPWDEQAGFADSDEAMTARLLEDELAFAGTPHRRHRLDLLDSQYVHGERSPGDSERLARWVEDWVAAHPDALVLLPAGAGAAVPPAAATSGESAPEVQPQAQQHPTPTLVDRLVATAHRGARVAGRMAGRVGRRVAGKAARTAERVVLRQPTPSWGPSANGDHVWVRDTVATALLGSPHEGVRVAFYEEVPYRFGGRGDQSVTALLERLGAQARRCELGIDRRAKAARVAAYASQVPLLTDGQPPLSEPGGLPSTERYWVVR